MKIAGLHHRQQRNQRGYFDELPFALQQRASNWLSRLLKRHPQCPSWLFPILVGQAKRLARMSDEERSAWGRSMLAKQGGYEVQRRYRQTGRMGSAHPAHRASAVSAAQRKWRKQERQSPMTGVGSVLESGTY